jgi:hypothetical protein
MNRSLHRIVIALISLLTLHIAPIFGGYGCMDNSYHLQKRGDFKNYHYVTCACPCSRNKILADGRCLRCNHRRDAHSQIIVSADDVPDNAVSKARRPAPENKKLAHQMHKLFGKVPYQRFK